MLLNKKIPPAYILNKVKYDLIYLLEKSATHMQDPFDNKPTDTAVTTIARTIEINIKQLLKEEEIPQQYQSEQYFIS